MPTDLPALWGLSLGIPILLLYLLKIRRQPHTVSSVLLWQQVLNDLQANAPWQRLRRNLLLFLQLALVGLLVYALADPVIRSTVRKGGRTILLLDTSGSMRATDVEPSRFEAARTIAADRIAGLGRGESAMLLAFDRDARIVQGFTSDTTALGRALAGIAPTDAPTRIEEGMLLAAGALGEASEAERTEVLLLSDGAFGTVPGVQALAGRLRFVAVGVGRENVAVTRLDIAAPAGAVEHEVFARCRNFGVRERTFYVTLHAGDALVDAREVTLPGGEWTAVLFRRALPPGPVEVRIDVDDALPHDDRAYAWVEPERELRVLLVGPGNPWIERAFALADRLDRAVTVAAMDPGAWTGAEEADLYVFDRFQPQELPDGRTVLFAPTRDGPGFRVEGTVARPVVADWDRAHPLLRNCDFSDVHVAEAVRLEATGGRVLLEGAGGLPLILGTREGERERIVVAFDLRKSDWGARASYLIFVAHLLTDLRAGSRIGEGKPFDVGEPVPLQAPAGTERIVVTGPDGTEHDVPVRDGYALFVGTHRTGIYRVRAGDRETGFAVNAAEEAESAIRPGRILEMGGKSVEGSRELADRPRPIWPWVAAGALLLCLGEWYCFHRRVQ